MNSPSLKQKLCWNCEGSVSSQIENCPYCGVYLSPEEESSNSLLKSPYPYRQSEEALTIPKPPYIAQEEEQQPEDDQRIAEEAEDNGSFEVSDVILPLISLTSAAVFGLFALALTLFSNEGFLTLKWNADYWYIYAASAFLSLIVGWFSLRRSV